ncbi:hypothetical protein [Streptomyces sp. HPF1205]|uniref:hypothetical protein n=1 Tax=Streptomyces sp. HPF1205 TaxID=2873262 RepID=UPI001CED7A8F|nr:hypothetical protein [Streptomyces sp. HPF1205]
MLLHIPIVCFLALVAFFLCRKCEMKSSHALACGAFGFYLADTSFAGSIQSAGANLVGMIGHIGF